jgi:hypothetical protein
MANKILEDKTFVIPDHVIKTVKPGTMRSDFVIRRKNDLTYYNMKRLKNFFDTQTEKDPKTYNALGEELKKWVDNTLKTQRDSMYKGKKIKSDIGMLNVFKSAHSKDKGNGSFKIRIPKPNMNARQIFTGKGLYENVVSDKMIANAFYNKLKKDFNFEYMSEPFEFNNSYIINITPEEDEDFSLIFKNGKIQQEMFGEYFDIDNYQYFYNYMLSAYQSSILAKDKPERAPKLNTQKGVYENIIKKTLKKLDEEYDVFRMGDKKIDRLRDVLDESLISKYSIIIESPLYNNVEDIISDIMYFENKSKKYKK